MSYHCHPQLIVQILFPSFQTYFFFSGQFLTPPDSSKKPPRQEDDNCFWSGIPEPECFIQGVNEWKSEDSFIKPAEPLDLDTGFDILTSSSEKTQTDTDSDSRVKIETPEIGLVAYPC